MTEIVLKFYSQKMLSSMNLNALVTALFALSPSENLQLMFQPMNESEKRFCVADSGGITTVKRRIMIYVDGVRRAETEMDIEKRCKSS